MTLIPIICGKPDSPEWREVEPLWTSPLGHIFVHRHDESGTYSVTHLHSGRAFAHEVGDEDRAKQFGAWAELKAGELGLDLKHSDPEKLYAQPGWQAFSALIRKARPRISTRYAA